MSGPQETDEQRRDRALKRMLNTPPTPHRPKADDLLDYVVIDGRMFVAKVIRRDKDGRPTEADLYKNPSNFRSDQPVERAVQFTGA